MRPFLLSLLIFILAHVVACADNALQRGDAHAQSAGKQKTIPESQQSTPAEKPDNKMKPEYVPDEFLVTFREGTPEDRIDAIHHAVKVKVLRKLHFGQMRVCHIKLPEAQPLEAVRQAYSAFPEVESVDPNYKVRIH